MANDALDRLRRTLLNEARGTGAKVEAAAVKGDRSVVCKNPENLTGGQKARLSAIERFNRPVYREKGHEGVATLAQTIGRHREGIEAALQTGLANAGSETTRNGVRLLTRLAYGFHSPAALIALIKLKFGGVRIPLPFRYACRAR